MLSNNCAFPGRSRAWRNGKILAGPPSAWALWLFRVLLERQLRTISLDQVTASPKPSPSRIGFGGGASIAAYTALAGRSHRTTPPGSVRRGMVCGLMRFYDLCPSHNIGATVSRGPWYGTRSPLRGLTPHEIGLVIVFCALLLPWARSLAGCRSTHRPHGSRATASSPHWVSQATGAVLLSGWSVCSVSWRHFPAKTWAKSIEYPV